mgnify:CR=1 FL=1
MKILPLHSEITVYLKKKGMEEKFEKQKKFFENNPFHPSLETELLEPKKMKIWSFRLDKKYRAIFIFRANGIVEIVDVNDHYQ